ncbi:MAG TPA: serine hydrolase domain-containing protein [Pseudomonadales bacterium]|nr:serine hydrolase domain-containing protein [Pseudomonadales bacterium]
MIPPRSPKGASRADARPRIGGRVDPAFRALGVRFAERLADAELGAALAVTVDGQRVVDLWGGWRDRARTRPWRRDTLVCAFSATKAVAALCALQAVAEGVLELDAPLADVWPELIGEGRETITLRHALAHRTGLVGFARDTQLAFEDLYDWPRTIELLQQERPWWTPGTAHGYHARTFGFLLGEPLRRASGMTLGAWLRARITGPRDLDLHIGLAAADHERCADLTPSGVEARIPEASRPMMQAMGDPATATAAAFSNPSAPRGFMNTAAFRGAELPAMNGHATARAFADLYGALAIGDETLCPASLLAEATRPQSEGDDSVLLQETCFGLGFMLSRPALEVGLSTASFGHAGAGGSLAFADPEARVGFCFLMNRMRPGAVTGNDSAIALLDTLRECLA